MRDPLPLSQVLSLNTGAPEDWRARLRQLQAINQSLSQWCAEPWVAQLRVANLRDGVLVIYSSSAAALVPLRHRSAAFLRWLQDRHGLHCQRLSLSVRPR